MSDSWRDTGNRGAAEMRELREMRDYYMGRSAGAGYGGLIAVAHAARAGYPIHIATRTTCAEHIAEGDDQKDNWAFGQPERSAGAALDVERLRVEVERISLFDPDYRIHTMDGREREAYTMADAALSMRDRIIEALPGIIARLAEETDR